MFTRVLSAFLDNTIRKCKIYFKNKTKTEYRHINFVILLQTFLYAKNKTVKLNLENLTFEIVCRNCNAIKLSWAVVILLNWTHFYTNKIFSFNTLYINLCCTGRRLVFFSQLVSTLDIFVWELLKDVGRCFIRALFLVWIFGLSKTWTVYTRTTYTWSFDSFLTPSPSGELDDVTLPPTPFCPNFVYTWKEVSNKYNKS